MFYKFCCFYFLPFLANAEGLNRHQSTGNALICPRRLLHHRPVGEGRRAIPHAIGGKAAPARPRPQPRPHHRKNGLDYRRTRSGTCQQTTSTTDSTNDLVSLLIGVNNQYRSRPWSLISRSSLDRWASHRLRRQEGRGLRRLHPRLCLHAFSNGRTDISEGIDAYNAANREISEGMGIRYFDITPTSRHGLDDPTLVASDGLHPSGKQYAIWVSAMMEKLKDILREMGHEF
ncbi:MAG: hypothetical protein IPN76_34835 [Saprospiraceae bacterium]|nr:hypothetical protein [Saprospiraceae bacterium]